MNKILVTGANGFIGTKLLTELSKQNYQIIALIKDEKENIDMIKNLKNVSIVYCDFKDIANLHNIIQDNDIETCVHLAWAGSFGDARGDYNLQLSNIDSSLNLIQELKKIGVKRFIGAGTLAEKDVLNYHLLDNSTPNVNSIYGVAKATLHMMSKALCNKLEIEHIWCQLSNTYGVGNTTNNFVNMASRKMLNGERASFTTGEQLYDFTYIDDTIGALVAVIKNGLNNKTYYLGSTKPRKLKEYIKLIKNEIDPNIKLYLGEIPFNGVSLKLEDYSTDNLVNDTGFIPSVFFEEGIKKTIGWLKEYDK